MANEAAEAVLSQETELERQSSVIVDPGTELACALEKNVVNFRGRVYAKNSHQKEFLQAFEEVYVSVKPLLCQHPKYLDAFESLVEPERSISFKITWFDDHGKMHVNRGYRVQYSSAVGPYKGGLRFHPSVTMSVIKFLGFEQIFKNSLTGLALGGAKGGSDFDPKGKSETEIMRFCQNFSLELTRHIGPARDVPAGDIGVGTREIGFMYGQYKKLKVQFEGAFTGKDIHWGGSEIRPEATGYGCVYFAKDLYTKLFKESHISQKTCVLSGCGNVAIYCAEKLLEFGAIVLTLSDSSGYIHCDGGFKIEDVKKIKEMKNANPNLRVSEFCNVCANVIFHEKMRPWNAMKCEIAFPCATQNEIDKSDALMLIKNGCRVVVEGANMPTTRSAMELFKEKGVIVCPAKASNAGGVAVSGLEMMQNAMRITWSREEVDDKLRHIMSNIFDQCHQTALQYSDSYDLITGANIAGFLNVANAVAAQGFV